MSPASDRAEWLPGLVGKPYKAGAGGPDAYDCYGLATAIEARLFGVQMPPRNGPPSIYRGWRRVDAPGDGALVMLDNGHGRHVGVFLAAERGVIHALENVGVVFDDLAMLPLRGFALKFWKFSAR